VVTGATTIVSTQGLSDHVQCLIEVNGTNGLATSVGLAQPFKLTSTPTPQTVTVGSGTFSASMACSRSNAASTGYSF
jgi:hypothetical protein